MARTTGLPMLPPMKATSQPMTSRAAAVVVVAAAPVVRAAASRRPPAADAGIRPHIPSHRCREPNR